MPRLQHPAAARRPSRAGFGAVRRRLNSVYYPLDAGDTVEIPDAQLKPISEKTGFSRTLKELRGVEGSIWAKIFGSDGLGAMFSFLRKRENDETLTVKKLLVQYFIPTPEYMKKALEIDNVAPHINATKRKKPVYLVTRADVDRGRQAVQGAVFAEQGQWAGCGDGPALGNYGRRQWSLRG